MKPLIQTKNLSKDFESGEKILHVVEDVSISINAGELTLIMGPSGCGKTTLLSLITGILTPTSGTVTINDTEITALPDAEKILFRRQHIGFIFQQFNLLPSLSTVENVMIPLIAAGVSLDVAESQARDMLVQLDMRGNEDKTPRQLSGGEQQRIAIARALIHDPSILVCDEPTSSLDMGTGEKIMAILNEKAKKLGKCVIVVTHDHRIVSYGTRIIRMDDGRIED